MNEHKPHSKGQFTGSRSFQKFNYFFCSHWVHLWNVFSYRFCGDFFWGEGGGGSTNHLEIIQTNYECLLKEKDAWGWSESRVYVYSGVAPSELHSNRGGSWCAGLDARPYIESNERLTNSHITFLHNPSSKQIKQNQIPPPSPPPPPPPPLPTHSPPPATPKTQEQNTHLNTPFHTQSQPASLFLHAHDKLLHANSRPPLPASLTCGN